tara:strand:- start:1227 stop:1415 length:189 start_codon:yes stop_codon:yes gene_type:complete
MKEGDLIEIERVSYDGDGERWLWKELAYFVKETESRYYFRDQVGDNFSVPKPYNRTMIKVKK